MAKKSKVAEIKAKWMQRGGIMPGHLKQQVKDFERREKLITMLKELAANPPGATDPKWEELGTQLDAVANQEGAPYGNVAIEVKECAQIARGHAVVLNDQESNKKPPSDAQLLAAAKALAKQQKVVEKQIVKTDKSIKREDVKQVLLHQINQLAASLGAERMPNDKFTKNIQQLHKFLAVYRDNYCNKAEVTNITELMHQIQPLTMPIKQYAQFQAIAKDAEKDITLSVNGMHVDLAKIRENKRKQIPPTKTTRPGPNSPPAVPSRPSWLNSPVSAVSSTSSQQYASISTRIS